MEKDEELREFLSRVIQFIPVNTPMYDSILSHFGEVKQIKTETQEQIPLPTDPSKRSLLELLYERFNTTLERETKNIHKVDIFNLVKRAYYIATLLHDASVLYKTSQEVERTKATTKPLSMEQYKNSIKEATKGKMLESKLIRSAYVGAILLGIGAVVTAFTPVLSSLVMQAPVATMIVAATAFAGVTIGLSLFSEPILQALNTGWKVSKYILHKAREKLLPVSKPAPTVSNKNMQDTQVEKAVPIITEDVKNQAKIVVTQIQSKEKSKKNHTVKPYSKQPRRHHRRKRHKVKYKQ